jgi:hypothetical protein
MPARRWFVLPGVIIFVLIALGVGFSAQTQAAQPDQADKPVRRTATPTSTPVPCVLVGTPTRVATPAYTPGIGCSSTPPKGALRADITEHPTTTTARFVNRSQTCSYPIGLATYRDPDGRINHQQLFDYRLAVIPPNSTLTLTVQNPPCAFQSDAFYGALIESFAGGVRYDKRRLADDAGHAGVPCAACVTATPTPTGTPLAPTPTPTLPPPPGTAGPARLRARP